MRLALRLLTVLTASLAAAGPLDSTAAGAEELPSFTRAVLKWQAGKLALPVTVSIQRRCVFGDMDAIGLDLRWSEHPKLLLSLEGMPGDTAFTPAAIDIFPGIKQFGKGYSVTLAVPPQPKPVLLGLYICKDSDGAGSCRDKPAIDIGTVIERYKVGNRPPDWYRAEDKIYYFRPVLLDVNTLIFPSQAMNDERRDAFSKILGEKLSGISDADPRWQKQLLLSRTLLSLPLGYTDGAVQIKLPLLEPRKCSGEMKRRTVTVE